MAGAVGEAVAIALRYASPAFGNAHLPRTGRRAARGRRRRRPRPGRTRHPRGCRPRRVRPGHAPPRRRRRGGRRQDCPARGRAGGASHVSSRLRVHRQPAIALSASAACLSSSMGADWFVASGKVRVALRAGPGRSTNDAGPSHTGLGSRARAVPTRSRRRRGGRTGAHEPRDVVVLDLRAAPTPGGLVGAGGTDPRCRGPATRVRALSPSGTEAGPRARD
jgi:hypothetical protein